MGSQGVSRGSMLRIWAPLDLLHIRSWTALCTWVRAGHGHITQVCTLWRVATDPKMPSLIARTAKLEVFWDQRDSSDTFWNTMEHSRRPAAPKNCLRREVYPFTLRISLWKQWILPTGWKRSVQWKQDNWGPEHQLPAGCQQGGLTSGLSLTLSGGRTHGVVHMATTNAGWREQSWRQDSASSYQAKGQDQLSNTLRSASPSAL